MTSQRIEKWRHDHDFNVKNKKGEKRTLVVLLLTALVMVIEIIAGTVYGSMALLADGWHMGTHVAAFMITIFAYQYSRKHASNPAFSFGTGKVNVLGGFASAIALAVVALVMMIEALERFINPTTIHFNEAIMVAGIGLVVNIVSAFLLNDHHDHHHHHEHEHDHDHEDDHNHDHNLRAAYLHVLADALTSLTAIVALFAGKYLGWDWMDPIMGIVGAIVITRWSYGLLKQTSPILLDASIEAEYSQRVVEVLESREDTWISDLHIWKVGANHYSGIISLVTTQPRSADEYKDLLKDFHRLSHLTIEVNSPGE